MSTPDIPISVDVQRGIIDASINASMLLNFLMGIYTMVYAGTVYLYISKKAAHFIVQWYFLDLTVVVDGDTRESIFFGTLLVPQWISELSDLLFYSTLMVSDGLLIWRCYHVWGQSFAVILVPLILFVGELGLFVLAIVLVGLNSLQTNVANLYLLNKISSASMFVPLGTTAITTFLIGYRIHTASGLDHPPSKKLFGRIMLLVMESAAVYLVALLFEAICIIVPAFTVVGSPLFQVKYYGGTVLIVAAGMAPTVLVARIALINPDNARVSSTVTHISALQFGSRHGSGHRRHSTAGEISVIFHSENAALASVVELKRECPA
ncbi:hypothetical protein CVT25_007725 [Psilocybe cyanescens]|uniref:G protein-coupled receptor n=1 Tax=Psilocybe cyanescens TaxID=93625 RepID=A0A409XHT8_PSICY|nr:hypothetical protein CVT25_007725 [Psilocybe cyanescens]